MQQGVGVVLSSILFEHKKALVVFQRSSLIKHYAFSERRRER